jgi:PAS domain S-box-containing protein
MLSLVGHMSARKRAEEVCLQKNFYETLLKTQSDLGEGLLVVENGHLVFCNEAFCEITGYGATELAALPNILDLAVPEERPLLEEKIARRLCGEAVEEHYETSIRHASGRRVELEVAARLLRRQGWHPQLVALVRDITARKRTEKRSASSMNALLALHEAGRLLNSTLELAEIGERLLKVLHRVFGLDAAVLHVRSQNGTLRVLHAFGAEDLRHTASARAARWAALYTKERQLFRAGRPKGKSRHLVGLCLPLQVQDRVVGVLEGYGVDRDVGEATIETLESLASQAASALDNARLYREVAEREAQLKGLVGKLLGAQEQERRRVAHEVHDGLTQVAIGTHQTLQAFAADHPPTTAAGQAKLNRVLQLARQTVREARHVITDLRPTALDDFGVAAALRLKVEALRAAGWDVEYDEALGDERLPTDIETALYRVAQEALANVRKHARTRRADVILIRQDNKVRLEVRDAGCGFDQHEVSARMNPGEHVGLSSMRERITLLGGECQIDSRPGAGTTVVAEVPLPGYGAVGTEHVG